MPDRIRPFLCSIVPLAAVLCVAAVRAQVHPPDEVAFRIKGLSVSLQREVTSLQYLLTYDELEALMSLGTENRCRRWIDDFWRDRDPIHTTDENEIRREHERRVEFARVAFRVPRWPGWDQRGEVYIRYGEPGFRQPLAADVDADGIDRPGELWYFPDHGMYVYFEDSYASGDYTYFTEHVRGPHGMRMHKIDEPIDAAFDAAREHMPVPPGLEGMSRYESFREMLARFNAVLEETPSAYAFDCERMRLPMVYTVDCFRGGALEDRVEVNAAYAVDVAPRLRRVYEATVVFWNIDREEVARTRRVVSVPPQFGTDDSTRSMVTQLLCTLPPDFYHVAVTVEDVETGRFASRRATVACEEFVGKLAISDILFAARIGPAAGSSPFNRGALEVVPHPYRRYRVAEAVPVYFEIYNMRPGRDGGAAYTVSYRIVPRTPRPTGFWGFLRGNAGVDLDVSSSFRSTSPGPDDVVHIAIGTENLWPGTFGLEVTVVDDVSDATVTREVVFHLVE